MAWHQNAARAGSIAQRHLSGKSASRGGGSINRGGAARGSGMKRHRAGAARRGLAALLRIRFKSTWRVKCRRRLSLYQ